MSGVPTVTKSGKKRIFYFDALRALAILAVIFFHSSKRIRALIMSYYSSPPNLHWIFGDFTFATCNWRLFIFNAFWCFIFRQGMGYKNIFR